MVSPGVSHCRGPACAGNFLFHKKWKYSLEGSLDEVLFAAELEVPKILVPRLPQNTSNLDTECVENRSNFIISCDNPLGTLMSYFIVLILITG